MKKLSKNGFLLLYFTGLWICGLWAPFQLFTRTRILFESYTVFDFCCLGLGIFFALGVVGMQSKNIANISLIGWIGETIFAYLSIYNTPLGIDGRGSAELLIFKFIPSIAGALGVNLTITFALILFGNAIQFAIKNETESNGLIKNTHTDASFLLITALIGLIIYSILIVVLPESLIATYIIIALCGSVTLCLIGFYYPEFITYFDQENNTLQNEPRSSNSIKITIISLCLAFIIWISGTLSLVLGILSFTARLQISSQTTEILHILANCGFGIGFLFVIEKIVHTKKPNYYWNLILSIGILMALFEYLFYFNRNSESVYDPVIGIALIFVTFALIQTGHKFNKLNKSNKFKGGSVLILLSWLIAAYTSYIPLKNMQFQEDKVWVIPILLVLNILSVIAYFFLIRLSNNQEGRTDP